MKLDIRLPIGMLFCTIGVLLVAHGLATPVANAGTSAGWTLDVPWGCLISLFSGLMLALARAAHRRQTSDPAA